MIEKYSSRCNLYIYLEGEQDSGIPGLAERIRFAMGMGLPVASLISQPLFSLQVCVRVSGADKDSSTFISLQGQLSLQLGEASAS